MLEDFRKSASNSFQEEDPEQSPKPHEVIQIHPPAPQQPFMGMTAPQRFVVSLMLFLMVSVLGALILVVGEKVFLF